jgi:predicted XRE-type DNA-binding protein
VVDKKTHNVFADLGFPDPEAHALKAALVQKIDELIKKRSLTQVEAAEIMGISQPDVSKMLKGQFRPFSIERLLRILLSLGRDVEISVKVPQGGRALGRITIAA